MSPPLRLGEFVATLALAQDNAFGQPLESQLRSCLLAMWLCDEAELGAACAKTVYWVALLRYIGCTGHAHEVATLFGDEIAIRARTLVHDAADPAESCATSWHSRPPVARPSEREQIIRMIEQGAHEWAVHNFASGCEVGDMLVRRLGFSADVREALRFTFERWNGKGFPTHARGEAIPLAMRVVHLSTTWRRSAASTRRRERWRPFESVATAPTIRRSQTCSLRTARDGSIDSPAWTLGCGPRARARATHDPGRCRARRRPHRGSGLHRSQVAVYGRAQPAVRGAQHATPPAFSDAVMKTVVTLRRAALLHDFGTTGVPNSIWDKPGAAHAGRVRPRRAAPDAHRADAPPFPRARRTKSDRVCAPREVRRLGLPQAFSSRSRQSWCQPPGRHGYLRGTHYRSRRPSCASPPTTPKPSLRRLASEGVLEQRASTRRTGGSGPRSAAG